MMTVFEITVALIVLLITILVILRRRQKCSSCSSKETRISAAKAPEPAKPQQKTTAADKSGINVEPTTVNSQITAAKVVAPQAKEPIVASDENNSLALPQDSILRRHYFTHLCTMIEALVPPRPTDSVLCRHYDTMIIAKIAKCLNDKKAREQLIWEYEKLSA